MGRNRRVVAQAWNVDSCRLGGFENRLTGTRPNLTSIDPQIHHLIDCHTTLLVLG
jgi:hypothetical protein